MAVPHPSGYPRGMRHRPGFTLLELLIVLALSGVLLSLALPRLQHWRDRAAVRAARNEIAAVIATTRLAAIAHGGAVLMLDSVADRCWIVLGDGETESALDLHRRHRVDLDLGGTSFVSLRYDGLGIGRVASRTVAFRRGSARAGLTVSAYGRVRRW